MKKIPKSKTDEEAARFWETHSFEDYHKDTTPLPGLRPEEGSPGRAGSFGAIVFRVAATFRLRVGIRSNPEPHSQAKACGYQLAVYKYRQSFVDVDSLRAYRCWD
jgi:hypothetical protein